MRCASRFLVVGCASFVVAPAAACGSSGTAASSGDGGVATETGSDSGGGVDSAGPGEGGNAGQDASEDTAPADAKGGSDARPDADGGIDVPSCPAGQRPFLLRNQCTQAVQVALTAGATTAVCGAGGTCSPGTCNTSNNLCYWPLPDLGPSQGRLAPGGTLTVCFEAPVTGLGTQWSGNLAVRTECDASGQSCPPQPATLAEFTLANQAASPPGTDFYDVSIINGLDVGMSMAPVAGTYAAHGGDPYSCGAPGASSASGALDPCSWSVQPVVGGTDETTWARAVAPGGASCTSDADCAAPSQCGLAQNGALFTHTCGAPLGWWTADQICGVDSSFGAPYDCTSTVQNANGSTSTYTQLYACAGPEQSQSCYSTGATTDCCGCGTDAAAWPKTTGAGFTCHADNPRWQSIAEPWLAFLKQACPTAYVYPFDDATSTFTCDRAPSAAGVAYVVTFCP